MTDASTFLQARRHPLKLIIFDCDGVLIDSEALCARVVAEILAAEGWIMTAEEHEQRFTGMSFHSMVPIIEAHLGRSLGAGWIDKVVTTVTAAMAEGVEPIPGARQALEAATAMGLKWRIASNSSHVEMDAKFARTGWTGLVANRVHSAFDVIAAGGAGKPAPDLFLAAAAAGGVAPSHCLVIEDSLAGVTAARAAGMDCLGLVRHGAGEALREAGAVVFRSMHEIPHLLRAAKR
jgi:HAD superfamily hydrolase (TIGR01509 family)